MRHLPFYVSPPEDRVPLDWTMSRDRSFDDDAVVTHISGRVFVAVRHPEDKRRVQVQIVCDASLLMEPTERARLAGAIGDAAINALVFALWPEGQVRS